MKKVILLISLIFSLGIIYGYTQDYIITKKDQKYIVKITSEDSINYYFTFTNNNEEVNTLIPKSNVKAINWSNKISIQQPKIKHIDTVSYYKDNFIYFYNDKLIEGKRLEVNYSLLGSPILILNSEKYNPSAVKFYKDGERFFANINKFIFLKNNEFAVREKIGRINVYEYTKYRNSLNGGNASKIIYFYNTGFNDLKQLTYNNLRNDLCDNTTSMEYLESYKRAKNKKITSIVIGSVLLSTGCILFLNQDFDESKTELQNFGSSYALIGASIVSFGLTFYFEYDKDKKINLAIDTYNK